MGTKAKFLVAGVLGTYCSVAGGFCGNLAKDMQTDMRANLRQIAAAPGASLDMTQELAGKIEAHGTNGAAEWELDTCALTISALLRGQPALKEHLLKDKAALGTKLKLWSDQRLNTLYTPSAMRLKAFMCAITFGLPITLSFVGLSPKPFYYCDKVLSNLHENRSASAEEEDLFNVVELSVLGQTRWDDDGHNPLRVDQREGKAPLFSWDFDVLSDDACTQSE